MMSIRFLCLLSLAFPVAICGQSLPGRELHARKAATTREQKWKFQVEYYPHFHNEGCYGEREYDMDADFSPDDPSMGRAATCVRALRPTPKGMLCVSQDLHQTGFPAGTMDARMLLRLKCALADPAPAMRIVTVRIFDGEREIPLASGLVTTESMKRQATGERAPVSWNTNYGEVDLGTVHLDPSSHLRVEIFWEGLTDASVDYIAFENMDTSTN